MENYFSKNLKLLRKSFSKSQTDIGLQLNKAHTSIGNWEKGISEPNFKEIEEIARIFEILPADLMFTDLSENKERSKKTPEKHANNDSKAGFQRIITLQETTIQNLSDTISDKNAIIGLLNAEIGRLKRALQKCEEGMAHMAQSKSIKKGA